MCTILLQTCPYALPTSHCVHNSNIIQEHDPDIQNVPLFATSPTYFKSILSTFYNFTFIWDAAADFLIPYQKYTYYPIMASARFNLYLLSWLHLLSPRAANLGSAISGGTWGPA